MSDSDEYEPTEEENLNSVKYLIDVKGKTPTGFQIDAILFRKKNVAKTIKYLAQLLSDNINSLFEYDDTLLHFACRKNDIETIKYLVEVHNADVSQLNIYGTTPFHLACLAGSMEIVRYLVEVCGANVNKTSIYEGTPFHRACASGSIEKVRYLAEVHNVDVNTTDFFGRIPFHLACEIDSIEIVRYLAEVHRVDVSTPTYSGDTPLSIALNNSCDIVNYLLINYKLDPNPTVQHLYLTIGEFPRIISWNRITSENWTSDTHNSFPAPLKNTIFTILVIARSDKRRTKLSALQTTTLYKLFRMITALKYYTVD